MAVVPYSNTMVSEAWEDDEELTNDWQSRQALKLENLQFLGATTDL